MNAKRVVIPVLMLMVCAAILVTYNVAAVNRTSPTPTPAHTPRPIPTAAPRSASTATPWPSEEPGSLIPAAGEPAPDFTLPSMSGDAVTLSDYRGQKNVVLLFYRTGG
jgi:cytochrome oxidase Cu insertion factor (SCO1/SenC/PrrC family)